MRVLSPEPVIPCARRSKKLEERQMRKSLQTLKWRLLLVALSTLALWTAAAVYGQTSDHGGHHPPQNANTQVSQPSPAPTSSPGVSTASPSASPSAGGMMEGGMEQMMERGGAAAKELYPSLMDLPSLTPERRAEIERLASERMEAGRAAMTAALERLSGASARGDYPAMQAATAEVREALAQYESGLAARRALAEGRPPRDVALQWFKRDMSLLPAADSESATGPLGLPSRWFHYFIIAILSVFAASMIRMYYHKMRRAETLLGQLASGATPPPPVAGAPSSEQVALSSVAARPAAPITRAPASKQWSGQLRVKRIFQETRDVKTFRLALPEGGDTLPFTFDPGQFLTVSVNVDGRALKRSYSISSSPCCQGWCEITVKNARGGRVSGHLHEEVREGDLLQISGPAGRFTFRGHEAPSVVLIAGGVGVTPLMSSIRYLTDQSWEGEIFLIYACASLEDVIFREELEYLSGRHPNLHVTITLDREDSPGWKGPRGYVTKELLLSAVPDIAARRVHLCGPPPMMEAVQSALAESGVPAEQVKTEVFLSPEPRRVPLPAAADTVPQQEAPACVFALSGKSAPLPPEKTVLEASEDVGVNIDNSCRQGYCGVCKVKLLSGEVTMGVEDALDESDRAQNIILACQAKSTGDVTVEA